MHWHVCCRTPTQASPKLRRRGAIRRTLRPYFRSLRRVEDVGVGTEDHVSEGHVSDSSQAGCSSCTPIMGTKMYFLTRKGRKGGRQRACRDAATMTDMSQFWDSANRPTVPTMRRTDGTLSYKEFCFHSKLFATVAGINNDPWTVFGSPDIEGSLYLVKKVQPYEYHNPIECMRGAAFHQKHGGPQRAEDVRELVRRLSFILSPRKGALPERRASFPVAPCDGNTTDRWESVQSLDELVSGSRHAWRSPAAYRARGEPDGDEDWTRGTALTHMFAGANSDFERHSTVPLYTARSYTTAQIHVPDTPRLSTADDDAVMSGALDSPLSYATFRRGAATSSEASIPMSCSVDDSKRPFARRRFADSSSSLKTSDATEGRSCGSLVHAQPPEMAGSTGPGSSEEATCFGGVAQQEESSSDVFYLAQSMCECTDGNGEYAGNRNETAVMSNPSETYYSAGSDEVFSEFVTAVDEDPTAVQSLNAESLTNDQVMYIDEPEFDEDLAELRMTYDNDVAELFWEYHVVYSQSYMVPVMFFQVWDATGRAVPLYRLWEIFNDSFQGRLQYEKWSIMTQQNHPILNRPFYYLHPCGTRDFLKILGPRWNPVLTWLMSMGPNVGLRLCPLYGNSPKKLCGQLKNLVILKKRDSSTDE